MAASPKQIAANRANALRSTGPKTEGGKEASRQNALKHGLTGGGVVLPGEDENEVAVRAAQLSVTLAPDGDVVAGLLVRQMAIASIRVERAYRHETALATERMRRAEDVFADERRALAMQVFSDLPLDPATCRRRLLAAPEGIDLLVERLQTLRLKAQTDGAIVWDTAEGADLDRCLGWRPEAEVKSRVGLLTRGIVCDYWLGLDPSEHAELDPAARLLWAVTEIRAIITAEIARLEAHRATLDLAGIARAHAQAPARELLDLDRHGIALRRYAAAAERTILKMLKELRILRAEARLKLVAPSAAADLVATMAAQTPHFQEIRAELGSFSPATPPLPLPEPKAGVVSILADLKSSYVPITIGKSPRRPGPTGP